MKKYKRGFSLIEVLAVVAIIALIAAFTVPSYQLNTTKARIGVVIPILDQLMHEVLIGYGVLGKPPNSLESVNGSGTGGYEPYVLGNNSYFLHYVQGSGWVNVGALVQLSVPSSMGKAIPGYVASTNGSDGAYNSISIAFYENNGTIQLFCGRWDSANPIYIPTDYLPPGCNSDNFITTVTGT